jgi:hypothetical protein
MCLTLNLAYLKGGGSSEIGALFVRLVDLIKD